jgi:hypothetical protein
MSNFARIVVALVSVTGLSACLGSGSGGGGVGAGGGGGGGGGTDPAAAFSSNYDAVTSASLSNAPTSDMPTSLNANYSGQMKVDVNDGSPIGTAYGDLDIAVDWTDGQTANPFSGTASNFTGTLVAGQTGDIEGTLSVDDSFGGTIGRTVTTIPLPPPASGSVTTATGAGSFTMTGDLTVDGTAYDTTVLLGGSFFRPGGTVMHGAVSGGVKEKGTGGAIFDAAAAGTFYLIQD